jgi:hypothetical protein
MNQFPDKGHVDRPRHDVDAIGAHIGSQFDLTNDDRFLGQHTQCRAFS